MRVFVNGQQRQSVLETCQQPGADFVSQYFPGDDDGPLHKSGNWVEYRTTGWATSGTSGRPWEIFTTGGVKKTARYRSLWAPRAVDTTANAFSDFFALVDAHNQSSAALYQSQMSALVDVPSWMRAQAVQRIAGNWDTWGWSIGKNMYVYKPSGRRWAMIPWDIDFGLGLPPGDPPTSNLFTNEYVAIANTFMRSPLRLNSATM